ncbi:MAG TPA: hypothetical protein VNQ77_17495 [Frankiaceae bacterium]|nr:hypothetical protein [Frankiaceae bacterium]
MNRDLSEDLLRRSLAVAGAGLPEEPARLPGVMRRIAERRRRRNAVVTGAVVAVLAVLPAAPDAREAPNPTARKVVVDGDTGFAAGQVVGYMGVTAACGAHGIKVTRGTVDAYVDGATLELVNDRKDAIEWSTPGRSHGTLAAGASEIVTLLDPPGRVPLTCRSRASGRKLTGSVRIVDPEGYYVSEALSCTPPPPDPAGPEPDVAASAVVLPPPGEEEPEYGRPEQMTLNRLGADRLAGDVVEQAGYPRARVKSYRVRRRGQVWATLRWVPAPAQLADGTPSFPNGGWILRGAEFCSPR